MYIEDEDRIYVVVIQLRFAEWFRRTRHCTRALYKHMLHHSDIDAISPRN